MKILGLFWPKSDVTAVQGGEDVLLDENFFHYGYHESSLLSFFQKRNNFIVRPTCHISFVWLDLILSRG